MQDRNFLLRQQAGQCIKEETDGDMTQTVDLPSNKMSLLTALFLACFLGLAAAIPAEERAVPNPKTPNQILDAVVERAEANIASLGWSDSKNVQNAHTDIPLEVSDNPNTIERLSITGARIVGFNSLRRSKSATFNADKSVLKGTVMFTDASIIADYDVVFSGVGEAKQDVRNGQVTERLATIFADLEMSLENNVPQNLLSYNVRTGNDKLDSLTNMAGSEMAIIHRAGFRKALRELVENTVATNIKVQINKAIQAWKAEATA
ncbi:hypothetical protein FHG87_003312 [Trinorchestia longiramus]|nr:hypothetical protein FHG87_003312 [Trinorchestia longiramus]